MIHKTAIVSPNAEIGNEVTIGPYSVIGDNVSIGDRTIIGPHAVIEPYVSVGTDCRIFQFAAVGAEPQDLKFDGKESYVIIGNNTVVREFVTIHRGTSDGDGSTAIGDHNFLMAYTHVAHDCKIGNHVVMANNTTLAGHISIGNFATVGGLVAIHQYVNIGEYAFVGGKSAVVKDIPPYVIASGDRARLHGLNRVGLKRLGFSQESLTALKKAYRIIFRYGLTINEAIERVTAQIDPVPEVENLIAFIKASSRGITR